MADYKKMYLTALDAIERAMALLEEAGGLRGRRAGRVVRPYIRLPSVRPVFSLSFRASAHTGMGIRNPRPLPLPLGEVAERSEDGEGKQRKAAIRRPSLGLFTFQ